VVLATILGVAFLYALIDLICLKIFHRKKGWLALLSWNKQLLRVLNGRSYRGPGIVGM
jgi:hypothetical protein